MADDAILKNLNTVIRSRRSIFPPSYIAKKIPRKVLESVLENANYAPTHRLTEPWRFAVFQEKGLMRLGDFMAEKYRESTDVDTFSQAKYDSTRDKVLKSGAVLIVYMKLHMDKVPEWEELAATACAVQNIWLTATAYGLGTYWSTPGILPALEKFLNLKADEKCIGVFYMGYHNAPVLSAKRTPIENKVTWYEV